MKNLIEFKDVWKIYKMGEVNVPALRGVSFNIERGELVGIVGPSGSGKSTCMHLIGTLDVPTRGVVKIKGKDITKFTRSELAKMRGKEIGFVFQTFNLIPSLTALQNVELPMIFQNVKKEERVTRAKELLSEVGLKHRINHLPSEMSGGERQRVAIARALANNPDIILADEPTGNLDSKSGKEIMDLLISFNKNKGKTVIIVTHDLNIAKGLKRLIHIKDGKVEVSK
ncbi:MAG: ABC transporter ATP-binding protein [Nanoarchaeota archaeon]|nr:ABC transporter ATP-binding protein [Nanoarchaeota archaeon]